MKNFEYKKNKLFVDLLGCIAGLVVLWCIFSYIPIADLEMSVANMKIFQNLPGNGIETCFYLFIAIISLLGFSLGFFSIKKLLYTTDDFIHDEIKDEVEKEIEENEEPKT